MALTLTRKNAYPGERIQIGLRSGGQVNARLIAWTTATLRVRRFDGQHAEIIRTDIAHVRSWDR